MAEGKKLVIVVDSWEVSIKVREYLLTLATPFGTSHSATTQRRNALIRIRLREQDTNPLTGYGEIGLPPKKISAGYLAYLEDVLKYCGVFFEWISEQQKCKQAGTHYDPFQSFNGSRFFAGVVNEMPDKVEEICRWLLECLDTCPENGDPASTFPRNGIEGAILDLWSQRRHQSLYSFITSDLKLSAALEDVDNIILGRSFYTVSLNPDIEVMIDQAKKGIAHTPYLKIKLDDSTEKGEEILNRILPFLEQELPEQKWEVAIDANGAWNPDVALHFLKVFASYKGRVFMLEQPFDTTLFKSQNKEDELEQWKNVLVEYEKAGILIFADESVSTAADLPKLKDYVNGVNIKLEKAGGFRAAATAIQAASTYGLLVWIGMMVGSVQSCSMGSHLLPLGCAGDLDGALYVQDSSQRFTGGFKWGQGKDYGHLTYHRCCWGIGTQKKKSS